MPEDNKLKLNFDLYKPENKPTSPSLLNDLQSSNYHGNAADFGKSSYDNPNSSNTDLESGDYSYIRGDNQGTLVTLGAGLLRAGVKATVEAAKTPAYMYALGEWTAKNMAGEDFTLDKALDNVILNKLDAADATFKEKFAPVYKNAQETNGSFLDQIFSASFLATEGADGLGYLIGMMAPGAAFKAAGMSSKLMKVGGFVGKNADKIELGAQTLVNTSIEALSEAKGVADQLQKAGVSPEEIAKATRETFISNMGILLLPNLIMNKNSLGRFSKDKTLLDNYRDAAGKLVENPVAKKQLVKEYGKSIGTAIVSEGFFEEGTQTSVENYEVNKAKGLTNDSWLEGVAKEYVNTLHSTEGLKSIVLGGLMGSMGGAVGQYRQNSAEEAFAPTISKMIKDNFQGFSVDNDIYKRDSQGNIQINPTTNQPIFDERKTVDALKNYILETKESQQKDLAALDNDKTLHDRIVHDQFTRYAIPFIQQGDVGMEVLNDHIDNASNTQFLMNEQTLANTKESQFDENVYKESLKKKAKELRNLYEDTQTVVSNMDFLKDLKGDPQELNKYVNTVLNAVFQENSKQLFYSEKIKELNNKALEIEMSASKDIPQNQLIVKGIVKEIEGLNKLLENSKETYNNLFKKEEHQKAFDEQVKDDKDVANNLEGLSKKAEQAEKEPVDNSTEEKAETTESIQTPTEKPVETIVDPIQHLKADIEKRRQEDFNNENESYRVIVGDEAFNDIVESGVVRTNAETKSKKEGGIDLSNRPTAYPSFSKGKASMDYAAKNPNNYIIVTEDSSIQPSKVGRHGKGTTMFPTDENGNHLKELSGEKIKVYKHIGNGEYILVYANGKEINAKYDAELAELNKQLLTSTNEVDEDAVSTNIKNNPVTSIQGDTQNNVDTIDINNVLENSKGINLHNNVVMMHLFNHYFKDGVFKFARDAEGYIQVDNNSGINITELNNIQQGDKVELRLVTLTKEQLSDNKKNIAESLKNPSVKKEDFDGHAIGIYSNGNLIGFVQEPHAVVSEYVPTLVDGKVKLVTQNKTQSEEVRKALIEYRKSVISKLQAGETVNEKILEKGNGNLYTKLKENGTIDATRDVLNNSREKDAKNNALLFAFHNGDRMVLPESRLSDKEAAEMDVVLSKFNNFGKKGDVFQIVKDLKGSYSIIPVYASKINDTTVNKIVDILKGFTNETKSRDIVQALNKYIYSSTTKNATLKIRLEGNRMKLTVNTEEFYLDEINESTTIANNFKKALVTQSQNISVSTLNNKASQEDMKERGTLVTNVLEYQGEYFVQPYVEYTHTLESAPIAKPTVTQEVVAEVPQTGTDIPTVSIDDVFDPNEGLNDDNALSSSKFEGKFDIDKFNKWKTKNLPQLSIADAQQTANALARLKANMVDAYGMFKDLTIYLFEGSTNKTAYHEAFHGVFRNMLNLEEKHAILKEAITKYEAPTAEQLEELQKGLSKQYSTKQLTYLYYEEKLADDFADFTNNYNERSFGQKILDFFNKILNYFNIFTNSNTDAINDLFNKVNTGSFKSKSIVKTAKNANLEVFNRPFEVFDDSYAYSKDLDRIFGVNEKSILVKKIGNQFLALHQANIEQGKPSIAFNVHKEIRSKYEDFFNKEDTKRKAGQPYDKTSWKYAGLAAHWYPHLQKEVEKYLSFRNVDSAVEFVKPKEGIIEEDLGDVEITSLRGATTKGLEESTSIAGVRSSSTRMKIFLSSIPVLENGEEKKDIFGITEYYPFDKLYYYIEENLTDIVDFNEQLDALRELADNKPEIQQVINKLTQKSSLIDAKEFKLLQNDFKTNFSKQQLAYTMIQFFTDAVTGKVTYKIFDANRESIAMETRNKWEDNLKDSTNKTIAEVDKVTGTVNIFGTKKGKDLKDQWDSLTKTKVNLNKEVVSKILAKVGIELSSTTLDNVMDTAVFKNSVRQLLNWYASDDKNGAISEAGRIALNRIVKFETVNVMNNYTSSFNNVENKNIYTVQLPSWASKMISTFNSDNVDKFEALVGELKKDPILKHSNILKDLLESDKYRKAFKLSYLDGLKDGNGDGKGTKFTTMTPKDYFNQQLALFQNTYANRSKMLADTIAKYIYITPSDKSMAMIIDAKVYNVSFKSLDTKNSKGGNLDLNENSEIFNAFYNVYLGENERIRQNTALVDDILTSKDLSRLKGLLQYYHISKENWSDFNNVIADKTELTNEEWNSISKYIDGAAFNYNYFSEKFNSIAKEHTANSSDILGRLKIDLKQEVDAIRDEMIEEGIITRENGLLKSISLEIEGEDELDIHNNINQFVASYALNSKLFNIEMSNLFNGDFAQYKPGDLQKRTYQSQAMYTNGLWDRPTFNVIVKKDVIAESESKDPDYKKINVTDAQVYVTPEFYREFLTANGRWSKEHDKAYAILEGTSKPKKIDEALQVLIGGIKPYYTGSRFDKNLNIQRFEQVKCAIIPLFKAYTDINPLMKEKREEMKKQGADMIAHESAFKDAIGYRTDITSSDNVILPLETSNLGIQVDNPEHILDAENDSLRQLKMLLIGSVDISKTYNGLNGKQIIDNILEMEASNIRESLRELEEHIGDKTNSNFIEFIRDMVTKRGATTNIEELLSILNGEFKYPLDNGTLSTQIENMISSIFTNQVVKQPFGVGGSGVQATSLGLKFRNLAKQQEEINKVELFDGFWTRKQIEEQKNKVFLFGDNTNDRLNTKYIPSSTQAVIRGLDNAIGIDTKKDRGTNNSSYFTDNDFDAFKKQVDEAINKAKDSGKIIVIPKDGIGTGKAMLKEKAPKLFEYLNNKLNDLQTIGEINLLQQELQWIKPDGKGGIEYAECCMPAHSKQFFDENGYLKDINNIPDELKQLVMYRIPTEGLHSMLPIRVVKFLPETMGNFILLPYEVTTQFGADFDFDKMYFIGTEFYTDRKTGNLIPYTISTDVKERYKQYLEYTHDSKLTQVDYETFKQFPEEQQITRAARNNSIVRNYLHLLTSIENYDLIKTPSGFDDLVKIKKDYFNEGNRSGDSFFSSRTQRDYKNRNHVGIALKGQWALHVSGHSYAVLMNLSTESKTKEGLLDRTKTINFNNISSTFDKHIDREDTELPFNKINAINGSLIADKIASVMAGVLDDIKDPLLAYLGINKYTTDVAAAIMRSGHNIDTAIKFIAQAGIKDMSKLLDANYNKVKIAGQRTFSINDVISDYTTLMQNAVSEVDKDVSDNPKFKSAIDSINTKAPNINDAQLEFHLDKFRFKTKGPISTLQIADIKVNTAGKKVKDYRDATAEEKVLYYAFQIRCLKAFDNYTKIANELVDMNKIFAINKEVGPNIENIISKKQLLEEITGPNRIFKGFNMEEIPTLQETYNAHLGALNFFNDYFPYDSEYYNTVKQFINNTQTSTAISKLKIEDKVFINSFIRTYIDAKFEKFEDIPYKYEDLFVSLPKIIENIMNPYYKPINGEGGTIGNITFEELRTKNLFLKSLKINKKYFDKDHAYFITLKGNRLDTQVKEDLITSFKNLYNNPNTKELAKQLIEYSFASTGFYTGLNSYSALIAPEILDELGYMDYRSRNINELINEDSEVTSEDMKRIKDQLIRNNPKLFTRVFDSQMFNEGEGKVKLPDIITTSPELVKIAGKTKEIVLQSSDDIDFLTEYIRVFDKGLGRTVIYKNTEVGKYEYKRVNPLGKKGFFIEINPKEDIDRSFLPSNNINKPTEEPVNNEGSEETSSEILNQDSGVSMSDKSPFGEVKNSKETDELIDKPTKKDDDNLPSSIKPC